MKGQNNFRNRMFFLLLSRCNKLEQLEFQFERIIVIYKHAGIVSKLSFSLHVNWPFFILFRKKCHRSIYKLHTLYHFIGICTGMKVQSYYTEEK